MARKNLLSWIDGYVTDDTSEHKSFTSVKVSGSVTAGSDSKFYVRTTGAIRRFTSLLGFATLRAWGVFLLAFGLMALVLHLSMGYAANTSPDVDMAVVIPAAALSVLGIFLVPFDKPAAIAFSDFPLTDYVFFEFFGLRRAQRNDDTHGVPIFIFFLVGISLGALSLAAPFWIIAAVIGGTVYLILALSSPEFSFFATFLCLPYLSFIQDTYLVIAALVGVSALSFIRKVFVGKRVYQIEQYDILIFAFLLTVIISGIVNGGAESFRGALMTVVFALGYVLSSSLVTNRRLADRTVFSIVASAVPMSVYVIIEAIISVVQNGISGFSGVHGSFDSPDDLAVFLLVAGVLAVYTVLSTSKVGVSVLCLGIFALIQLALVCTLCIWALVAQMFAIVAYGILKLRRFTKILLSVLVLSPYVIMLLPSSWFTFLEGIPMVSGMDIPTFLERWKLSQKIFIDNIFLGIGSGSECFGAAAESVGAHTSYNNSGSFLLQIGLESGIIALLLFLLIFAVLLRHRARYRHYVKHSSVRYFAAFTMVTLVTLFVFGAFEHVWDDAVSGYMFWCILGLATSALRMSKHDYDDRVGYFSDVRSYDSSAIDIDIE